ncbi:MAG TPA: energy-coupling factor transporter transmembrane component T [Acidimicrobiales bacterium]|nr:energy-coupling factor transporter transmembrane component T [Acidimicrobiales bacterium]
MVPLVGPALFIRFVGIQGLRNVLSYEAKDTPIHRLDPRLKLLYPIFIGVSSVLLPWQWTYVLFALTLVPWVLLRPSAVRVRILAVIVVTPALLSIWSQGLYATTPHDRLIFAFPVTMAWVGTVGLSKAGLVYGAHQAARVLVTASASLILVFTTQPSDVVWATTRLLAPHRLGLAISVGVRFLPTLFERLNTVMRAAEVRGYDFTRPDSWWRLGQTFDYARRMVRALPLLTVPILVGSLRGCGQMALVADARAFNVNKHRTTYRVVSWHRADYVALAAAGVVGSGVLTLLATGYGRF